MAFIKLQLLCILVVEGFLLLLHKIPFIPSRLSERIDSKTDSTFEYISDPA